MKSYIQLFTFIVLIKLNLTIQAQTIQPSVLATTGKSLQYDEGYLQWTIGEPLTTTLNDNNQSITQGFHQTNLNLTSLIDSDDNLFNIKIYPNPTNAGIYVDMDSYTGRAYVYIYSIDGSLLSFSKFEKEYKMSLTTYPPGIYLIRIDSENAEVIGLYYIIKI